MLTSLNAWTAFFLGLVVYSYICLPVIMTVIAKAWRSRLRVDSARHSSLPDIAVVVAAHNERGTISHLISSCLESDYPSDRIRIFVGDDGSSDGTPDEIRGFADPRVHLRAFSERRGKISVLNDLMADREVREFGAPVTFLCDAKSVLGSSLFRDIAAYFDDPSVGCVACKLTMESEDGKAEGEGLYWRYEMHLKEMEDALGVVMGCNGGGFAIRTDLYEAVPAGTIVEDFVISLRALIRGYKIRFCRRAEVRQPACADVRAEWVRKIRIGAGNFQSIRLCAPLLNPLRGMPSIVFWGHKVLRWLTPFLLIAGWICSAAALAVEPAYVALHAVNLAAGLFLAVSGALCWKSPKRSWPSPVKLGGYFALMNLALVVGFFRWLFKAQKVTWERADRAWTQPAQRGV